MPFKPSVRALLLCSIVPLTLPAAALAQSAATDAAAGSATDANEIVVTGARYQALREVETKRAIAVISDSISADEIGTLPDFGLGEALTRVPGVSTVQNNARGEAQFLSLRGLNADYNLVQIDGVPLPANEVSRRNVSLDVIPSSLASRVEVYKSVTAQMNGNSVGGVANLRTRSAFDKDGETFVGGRFDIGKWGNQRVRGNRGPSGQAEVIGSTTFGSDHQFGIVLSANYFRRDSASLNSASDNYLYYDPTTGARLNQITTDVTNAFVMPDRRRWLHYDNVRERYGFFGKFEFDNHSTFRAALTAADFRHINDEERQSNILIANGNPVAGTITATGGRLASANAQVDLAEFYQVRRIRYADFYGELTPNDSIKADFGVNYAVATYRQDARLATYRIANTTNLGYTYSIVPGEFTYFNPANPTFATTAANYNQFEFGTTLDNQREEALTARANISYNLEPEDRGLGLAAGGYLRFLDRTYDFTQDNYRPASTNTFLLSSVLAPETFAPYNGNGQTLLLVDPAKAQAFFDANRAGFPANTTNVNASLQSDYDLTENITAAYVMGRYATDNIRLTAGLRYEGTHLATGSNTLRSGVFTYGRTERDYHQWLPSAQIDWDVTPQLRARAAFSRTIGRPNYSDLAARASITTATDGSVTISSGNPNLRPRRSDNFDLSLEFYPHRGVVLSVAGFAKNIDDEILTVRNQATEPFEGVSQLVTRVQPVNGSASRVKGVELNAVVSNLWFLPKPLDGFGFSANLTLLDPTPPSITLADGVTQRQLTHLFESSNVVANVKLFYTLGPVTLQGAWNHLSPQLFSVSTTDRLQDRVYDTVDIFDAQVRFELSRNVTIVAQGKNLTNSRPRRMFGPNYGLLREELDNGSAYYIGAQVRF